MKIPSFRRLMDADFPEEFKDLVKKIAVSINNGFEILYEALNKKISLNDNIACTLKDVEVDIKEDGRLKSQAVVKLDVPGSVIGISVLNARCLTDSNVYPNAGIYLNFQQSGDKLTITHAYGLPANYKFSLKIVAFV